MKLLIVFFLVGSLALVLLGVNADLDRHTSTCPLMGMPALCQMNPIEHSAAWQSMFVAASVFIVVIFLRVFSSVHRTFLAYAYSVRPFIKVVDVRDPLQQALSDGILNPKIYNLSVF